MENLKKPTSPPVTQILRSDSMPNIQKVNVCQNQNISPTFGKLEKNLDRRIDSLTKKLNKFDSKESLGVVEALRALGNYTSH